MNKSNQVTGLELELCGKSRDCLDWIYLSSHNRRLLNEIVRCIPLCHKKWNYSRNIWCYRSNCLLIQLYPATHHMMYNSFITLKLFRKRCPWKLSRIHTLTETVRCGEKLRENVTEGFWGKIACKTNCGLWIWTEIQRSRSRPTQTDVFP